MDSRCLASWIFRFWASATSPGKAVAPTSTATASTSPRSTACTTPWSVWPTSPWVQAAYENRIHLALIKRLAVDALRIRVHGSAALDLAWLAAGHLNATVMLSNLPWDVSAGALLVREAGGLVYDVDGSRHSTRSRFTIASAPSLSASLRAAVADAV